MTVNYTTLLALGQPVTGTESGTWGDDVNNSVTSYLDIAIAGTLTLTGDGAVTLANTQGTNLATNISSTSAQYYIIKIVGPLTVTKVITGPSSSKTYIINNTDSTYGVTIKASGQTGVTVAAGQRALVVFNGTDYVQVGASAGGSNTQVQYNSSGALAGSSNFTFNGTTATINTLNLTNALGVTYGGTGLTSGTSGGVPYFSSSTTIGTSAALTANALMVGGGAGAAPATVTTGTGVVTALGVNTGSAGAFVVNGGALGTPSSGTLTNATGLPLSTGVTGTLPVANGGTALATTPTNGQLLIGNGTGYTLGTLTAGSNITITNGAGSITIASTGGGGGGGGTATSITQITASAGQTVFTVSYVVGYVSVYLNGALLASADYTATSGTSITLASAAASGDIFTAVAYGNTAATATSLGAVYGSMTAAGASPYLTALGYNAAPSNSGAGNTAVGQGALQSNGAGAQQTAVGYQALNAMANASQAGATAVGYQAGLNFNTADAVGSSTFVGFWAGKTTSSGTDNTFIGGQAGQLNTTGGYNATLGGASLQLNTTGSQNVAVGFQSLRSNTTASGLSAVGYQAAYTNANAGAVISAFGYQAAYSYNSSNYIDAFGYQALKNSTGGGNAAFGANALGGTTSGTQNAAFGLNALQANTTGSSNTAMGYLALTANTTNSNNTAIGNQAMASTTPNSNNVAVGYLAGYAISNSGGTSNGGANVCLGTRAGYGISTGYRNIAIGSQDPYYGDAAPMGTGPITGYLNIAIGNRSLTNLTSGYNNIAMGDYSGGSMTTGYYNIAIGGSSLGANNTGYQNTAVGYQALYNNTTGTQHTAVGYQALYNTSTGGSWNTGIGQQAGLNITTGIQNTMIGAYTGVYVTSLTTGSYCIHLGTYTQASASGVNNEIVIGYNIAGKGANTAFIDGSNGVYQRNNSSSWSTVSDRRLKKNIVDNNEGIELISQIRVRNFEYRLPEEVDPELKPNTAIEKAGVQLGVIAQELQQVCPDCVTEQSTGVLSVNTESLTWHMINAIKQLSAKVDALQAELNTLKGA